MRVSSWLGAARRRTSTPCPDPSGLGVSSSRGHRWPMKMETLLGPALSPSTSGHPDPRGNGFTQGQLCPASSGGHHAFVPISSTPRTWSGSPSSSWFRVFHSRLMGAAPSWMRHLKLASWPCCTVLLGGSMEITGLLRPGGAEAWAGQRCVGPRVPPPPPAHGVCLTHGRRTPQWVGQ